MKGLEVTRGFFSSQESRSGSAESGGCWCSGEAAVAVAVADKREENETDLLVEVTLA